MVNRIFWVACTVGNVREGDVVFDLSAPAIEALIPLLGGVLGAVFAFRKARPSDSPYVAKARRLLRWLSPAMIVFSVLLFATGSPTEKDDAATIARGIRAKVSLPVVIDADTQLDDVLALSETELGYVLTLTGIDSTQVEGHDLADRLEANVTGGACQNQDYLKLLNAGLSVAIIYRTRDQKEVTRIVVEPKDCGL